MYFFLIIFLIKTSFGEEIRTVGILTKFTQMSEKGYSGFTNQNIPQIKGSFG